MKVKTINFMFNILLCLIIIYQLFLSTNQIKKKKNEKHISPKDFLIEEFVNIKDERKKMQDSPYNGRLLLLSSLRVYPSMKIKKKKREKKTERFRITPENSCRAARVAPCAFVILDRLDDRCISF